MCNKELIRKFLAKHTIHNPKTAKIRKGIKSDYSVTTDKGYKVNFWIDKENISYGIIDWGIASCVTIESLL